MKDTNEPKDPNEANESEGSPEENKAEENKAGGKMTGTAAWFSEAKGYGFIIGEDGEQYFVHFSEIKLDGFKILYEGQKVEFEPEKDRRGRNKATNVRIIARPKE